MRYLLAGLCLIFDGMYIYCKKNKLNVRGLIVKSLAALCFIMVGFLAFKNKPDLFIRYIFVGLIFDGLGDFFLGYQNLSSRKIIFVIGTILFFIGHLFYALGLLKMDNLYLNNCVVLGIIAGAILIHIYIKLCKLKMLINIGGFLYLSMLMIMFCLSVGIYLSNGLRSNFWFMIGALLFVSSDCILIINNFSPYKRSFLHPIYSFLYFLGQILISLSLHL